MKKLSKLREWLTLDEACDYLSLALGEEVQKKDIYRLALDEHLKISVNFVNKAYVRMGKIIPAEEVEWIEMSGFFDDLFKKIHSENGTELPNNRYFTKSIKIDDERYIDLNDAVTSIEGVWDLTMFGNERLDIEHYFQISTGGPGVSLTMLDGVFVERGDVICAVQESWEKNEYQLGSIANKERLKAKIIEENLSVTEQAKIWDQFEHDRSNYLETKKKRALSEDYYPAGSLPVDSVLVVKMAALLDFISQLDDESEKPLGSKERNTYLVLFAALCKEAQIDYKQRGISTAIQHLTESMGAPISDDTIRNILNKIDIAVESRS